MRKLCRVLMALPLLSLSINVCFAQNTPTSVEQSVERSENFKEFQNALSGGNYYLLLSFKELPGKAAMQQLERHQIKLLEYRSKNTYLAAVPADLDQSKLSELNIVKVKAVQKEDKLDSGLLSKSYPDWAKAGNGAVDVAILFHENIERSTVESFLKNKNVIILEGNHRGNATVIARVEENQIEAIAASPLVAYVDMKQEPIQKMNHETCVSQKVNILNSPLPGGYNLRGKGVAVGVGDGGQLGDHIDFGDRVINEANGTYSSFGDHGDHVSGIIGGAGNLNPRHRGMAPECTVVTQKTSQITYNVEDYINQYRMVLTNNSYGTSFNCETNGSYNYSAQTLDWQMREYPKVLHLFAAGNSGGGTCEPYPTGYRSVLRYYQSAKNVLTVGMAEENRVIAVTSSRGPVLDGRIKPEIIGVGRNVVSTSREYDYSTKGGTSMASPSVTGTLALLVEKYRLENNDEDPDGALMKAIACNTADDLGNSGPDYIHGFGLINGRRAAEVIAQNQFQKDEIAHGDNKMQSINVPAGTKQLKVMLYWHDKEAAVYPDKALVNNLDITVITPSGETILPWTLDPTATGVANDAVRGVDDINNIEQVTINTPVSGTYTILIDGKEIPFGPQEFYTTYDLIREEVVVTHPFGGESFVPDNYEYISWDADITNTNTFRLEYSLDGGNSWLEIAPAIAADQRTFKWAVPQVYTPDAKVRVKKNGTSVSGESTSFFNIMKVPTELVASPTCEQKIMLTWEASEYAMSYEVFMYNGKEMEMIGNTEEIQYVVDAPMEIGNDYWFSIRALGFDGNFSQRITAVFGTPEEIEICPWDDNPVVQAIGEHFRGRAKTSQGLGAEKVSMLIKNTGSNNLENFEMFYSINGGNPVQETFNGLIESGESMEVEFDTKADMSGVGTYHIDAWVEVHGNNFSYTDSLTSTFYGEQLVNSPILLPFKESFTGASSRIYSNDKLGLDGCVKWDVDTHGLGEIVVEQGAALTLRPTVIANGLPIQNNAILTLNMSQYENMNESVELNFEYRIPLDNISTSTEAFENAVYVRGTDTDEWLLLYTLNRNTVEWQAINDLDVKQLLADNGQAFSTSFQIKFTNDNSYPIAFNNIVVDKHEEGVNYSETATNTAGFSAEQVGEEVVLEWKPADDKGSIFEVEVINYKKANFEVIGIVSAESTTTEPYFYTFTDIEPGKKGRRDYRIKQINADGSVTYSPVLSVLINNQELDGVFPNPFVDHFQLAYTTSSETPVRVMIADQNGKVIQNNQIDSGIGKQSISIQVDENLPAGMYLVKVIDGTKTTCHKVIKQ